MTMYMFLSFWLSKAESKMQIIFKTQTVKSAAFACVCQGFPYISYVEMGFSLLIALCASKYKASLYL